MPTLAEVLASQPTIATMLRSKNPKDQIAAVTNLTAWLAHSSEPDDAESLVAACMGEFPDAITLWRQQMKEALERGSGGVEVAPSDAPLWLGDPVLAVYSAEHNLFPDSS